MFSLTKKSQLISQRYFHFDCTIAYQAPTWLLACSLLISVISSLSDPKKKLISLGHRWLLPPKFENSSHQEFINPPPGNFDFNPLRPTGHWRPSNVIVSIFTIKLLHLLFFGAIDLGKVKNYKNFKKYKMVL